jgi:uncharacterized protein (DUF58 family)
VLRRRSTVFLISDFLSENYEKALHVANKKHDIIAISITDPRELTLPDVGLIDLEDAETGELISIDTGSMALREGFARDVLEMQDTRETFLKSIGVDQINIVTDRSYVEPITRFFRMRAKRLAS